MSISKIIESIERGAIEKVAHENKTLYGNIKFPNPPKATLPKIESGEDVLTISVDLGKDTGNIPLLMVARKDSKGMSILKVFQREEATELYEKLIGVEKK